MAAVKPNQTGDADQSKADDNLIDDKAEVMQAFNQPEVPEEYDDPLDGDKPDERLDWSDVIRDDQPKSS